MQVNFIGHGLISDNKLNVGDQVATAFGSKVFNSFYGFVAFAATSGILKLLPKIQVAQKNYDRLIFFIGVDNKGTSKQALELLVEKGIETYIYHTPQEYVTYHPKLFLFEGVKHSRIIIGSSNMTHSGFINNIEASVQLDFQPKTDKQGNKLLTEVKQYFKDIINLESKYLSRLDKDLIKKYDEEGLLYSQFGFGSNKEKETKPTDGENQDAEIEIVYPPNIEFGQGELPKDTVRYDRNPLLNERDLENFDFFLDEYRKYKAEINPTGVVNIKSENRALFNWYRRIKELIKAEQLPDEFANRLDEVGFPLGDGKYANSAWKWEKNYQKLLKYMKDHNMSYAYVPQHKDRNHPDYSLGYWFARQKLRKDNKIPPPFLTGEFEKLQAVNFKWESVNAGGQRDDDTWLENYFRLEEFKEKHKHANPSQNSKDLILKKLAKWMNDQITLNNSGIKRKDKRVYLNSKRKELLDELGVDFNWQHNKNKRELEKQVSAYLKFRDTYPDETPKKGDNRFRKVIQWKSQIRYRYKGDTSPENKWRMDILNSDRVKFPW